MSKRLDLLVGSLVRLATGRAIPRVAASALAACGLLAAAADPAPAAEPIQLTIVGGLGGVSQYVDLEQPFWLERVRALTGGRVQAVIHPSDRAGLRAHEMLDLMRMGVVPFGTAILAVVAGEDPEIGAVDLPGLSPDIQALKVVVGRYREHLRAVLRERHGTELLAVYTYPAQVLFCRDPIKGLSDIAGRRVRTSSVNQSDFVSALGGVPIMYRFAGIPDAMAKGVFDCAVTGAASGRAIGLTEVASFLHALPITWGVSVFGANLAAWDALPEDVRDALRAGLADLEASIWDAAARETRDGVACSTGSATCPRGSPARMTLVPLSHDEEEQRRRLLSAKVLPGWVDRCGMRCVSAWNDSIAPVVGITATLE